MTDSGEKWISEAMKLWENEFEESDYRVSRFVFDRWSNNPRNAQIFVMGSRQFRLNYVMDVEAEIANSYGSSAGPGHTAQRSSLDRDEPTSGAVDGRMQGIMEAVQRLRENQLL